MARRQLPTCGQSNTAWNQVLWPTSEALPRDAKLHRVSERLAVSGLSLARQEVEVAKRPSKFDLNSSLTANVAVNPVCIGRG